MLGSFGRGVCILDLERCHLSFPLLEKCLVLVLIDLGNKKIGGYKRLFQSQEELPTYLPHVVLV